MRFLFVFLLLGLSACSSLKQVERDQLNHPAMELTQSQTPQLATPLTQLGTFKTASSSGSCGACAH